MGSIYHGRWHRGGGFLGAVWWVFRRREHYDKMTALALERKGRAVIRDEMEGGPVRG
jgi:hypothetical protein